MLDESFVRGETTRYLWAPTLAAGNRDYRDSWARKTATWEAPGLRKVWKIDDSQTVCKTPQNTPTCLEHSFERLKVSCTLLKVETSISKPRWLPCTTPTMVWLAGLIARTTGAEPARRGSCDTAGCTKSQVYCAPRMKNEYHEKRLLFIDFQ